MDEIKLLISRIEDLAQGCKKKFYPEFSKFLDMHAQVSVKNIKSSGCIYHSFGGYEDAERKIIGCFPEEYDYDPKMFPIKLLEITPSDSQGLTHRDYLGSILGLGIKRECIGDIVTGDGVAYAFCMEDISDYILYNLKTVGRCPVKVCETEKAVTAHKNFKRLSGTVASQRLDCVLSFVLGTSRSKVEQVLSSDRVMVNYMQEDSANLKLKPRDVVSVRGFGKFIYVGDSGNTKKGRLRIDIDIYS